MIKIKHNNETYVEESDLWMICQCIDSLVYLLNELEEDYFAINPDDKEKLDEIIGNSVENSSESGIIKIETFNSKGDPMYEVMGSAFESNPKEVQEIIEQLKEWGVGINYGSSTLAYGCTQRGKPGTLSITKNASYSAWLHEFQHIKMTMRMGGME